MRRRKTGLNKMYKYTRNQVIDVDNFIPTSTGTSSGISQLLKDLKSTLNEIKENPEYKMYLSIINNNDLNKSTQNKAMKGICDLIENEYYMVDTLIKSIQEVLNNA